MLTHYCFLFFPLSSSALSKEIEELNIQFREANGELDVLQSEASLMSKRLSAASKLIAGKRFTQINDMYLCIFYSC